MEGVSFEPEMWQRLRDGTLASVRHGDEVEVMAQMRALREYGQFVMAFMLSDTLVMYLLVKSGSDGVCSPREMMVGCILPPGHDGLHVGQTAESVVTIGPVHVERMAVIGRGYENAERLLNSWPLPQYRLPFPGSALTK